jgi:hypothetical protein
MSEKNKLAGALSLMKRIQSALSPDLLKKQYVEANKCNPMHGHCYVASEALYHGLGDERAGYVPVRGRDDAGIVHWWLKNRETGEILDPTAMQYTSLGMEPPYSRGTPAGFLTRDPSQRARTILERIKSMNEIEDAR